MLPTVFFTFTVLVMITTTFPTSITTVFLHSLNYMAHHVRHLYKTLQNQTFHLLNTAHMPAGYQCKSVVSILESH